jgi:hypothetical protein
MSRNEFESFLSRIVEFNKRLNFELDESDVALATNKDDLLKIFQLRSEVYKQVGYSREFPDPIDGMSFDDYDLNSAILYVKKNGEVTGTCRLVFDSDKKLPSDKRVSYDPYRKRFGKIGEISKNIVKHDGTALNLEYKYLMRGLYYVFNKNEMDMTVSLIRRDHLRIFKNIGAVEVLQDVENYGGLSEDFILMSCDPSKPTRLFLKAFLKN